MTESTEVRGTDAGNLQLETWPIGRLVPSPRNARKHPKAQIAEIAGSIAAFGFANPILVDPDGEVIAGHGRLAAAKQLGISVVPVIVISGLTDLQKRELMLADNRIALNAGWNREMLDRELKDLALFGADLEALGFSAAELNQALGQKSVNGLTDEDDVPAFRGGRFPGWATSGAWATIASPAATAPMQHWSRRSWATRSRI